MDMEYEFLVLELRSLPENTSGIIRKSSRTSSKEERFVNGTNFYFFSEISFQKKSIVLASSLMPQEHLEFL